MSLTARRLLRESPPIAAILLFWSVVSWFGGGPDVSSSIRTAGFVVAAAVAVVRGVALADDATPFDDDPDIEALLHRNGRVLLAAGPWYLAAILLRAAGVLWDDLLAIGLFTSPADWLVGLLTNVGLLVVVLYVVAVATATLRLHWPGAPSPATPGRSDGPERNP